MRSPELHVSNLSTACPIDAGDCGSFNQRRYILTRRLTGYTNFFQDTDPLAANYDLSRRRKAYLTRTVVQVPVSGPTRTRIFAVNRWTGDITESGSVLLEPSGAIWTSSEVSRSATELVIDFFFAGNPSYQETITLTSEETLEDAYDELIGAWAGFDKTGVPSLHTQFWKFDATGAVVFDGAAFTGGSWSSVHFGPFTDAQILADTGALPGDLTRATATITAVAYADFFTPFRLHYSWQTFEVPPPAGLVTTGTGVERFGQTTCGIDPGAGFVEVEAGLWMLEPRSARDQFPGWFAGTSLSGASDLFVRRMATMNQSPPIVTEPRGATVAAGAVVTLSGFWLSLVTSVTWSNGTSYPVASVDWSVSGNLLQVRARSGGVGLPPGNYWLVLGYAAGLLGGSYSTADNWPEPFTVAVG